MDRYHPFIWLSESRQKTVFWILFVVTVGVMICMQNTSTPLETDAAPLGIVSFELAGDLESAQKMIQSWGQEARIYAGLGLGLDYLYMVFYSCTIALGCVILSRTYTTELFIRIGITLAGLQFCAALLDCVENYALINILFGSVNEIWPPIAKWCAIPKFVLVILGLLYVLITVILIMIKRLLNARTQKV